MKKEKTIPCKISQDARKKRNADLDIVHISGYTLLPPEDDIDPEILKKMTAYITDFDLMKMENTGKAIPGDEAYILLGCREGQFEGRKNPVYAIDAFLIAHDAGLYPPMWALNYVIEVFKKYYEVQGTMSLDKLFGLSKGKGKTKPFLETVNEERDQMLMVMVYQFRAIFGCTVDEATHLVARRLEDTPYEVFNKTMVKVNKLSEDTLKSLYLKKWKKFLESDKKLTRQTFSKLTEDKKAGYLVGYPEDAIPERLKCYLPKNPA